MTEPTEDPERVADVVRHEERADRDADIEEEIERTDRIADTLADDGE